MRQSSQRNIVTVFPDYTRKYFFGCTGFPDCDAGNAWHREGISSMYHCQGHCNTTYMTKYNSNKFSSSICTVWMQKLLLQVENWMKWTWAFSVTDTNPNMNCWIWPLCFEQESRNPNLHSPVYMLINFDLVPHLGTKYQHCCWRKKRKKFASEKNVVISAENLRTLITCYQSEIFYSTYMQQYFGVRLMQLLIVCIS